MSKTAEVGPAVSALKAKLEARAEKLLARVSAADTAGDQAYAIADGHLDKHEAELKQMESELRQLGNEQVPPFRE